MQLVCIACVVTEDFSHFGDFDATVPNGFARDHSLDLGERFETFIDDGSDFLHDDTTASRREIRHPDFLRRLCRLTGCGRNVGTAVLVFGQNGTGIRIFERNGRARAIDKCTGDKALRHGVQAKTRAVGGVVFDTIKHWNAFCICRFH